MFQSSTRRVDTADKERLLARVAIRIDLARVQTLGAAAVISIKCWLSGVAKTDDNYTKSMFNCNFKTKYKKTTGCWQFLGGSPVPNPYRRDGRGPVLDDRRRRVGQGMHGESVLWSS